MRLRVYVASIASLVLAGCPGIDLRPRYITDPAMTEVDPGPRRGDKDDRWALSRLSRISGFPPVSDPTDAARDAEIAAATVAVGTSSANSRGPDVAGASVDPDLRDAMRIVLRRRRRAALHAIALALAEGAPMRREAALALVRDAYWPCRSTGTERPPCGAWPETTELVAAVSRAAASDTDADVRRRAVASLQWEVGDALGSAWEPVAAALDRETDPEVRAGWFDLLERRPPPPPAAGIELARRLAPEGIRVRKFVGKYLAESNRGLLEDAYARGDENFRMALGNAIFDAKASFPWTVTLVERGLFDADADVRACFAGDVTALDPVPESIRSRLATTAATWESSRNALSFLRAKDEGRPIR